MACGGCGKGRQGTAAVKERKRSSAGSAMITSQTTSNPVSTTPAYDNRYQQYLRDRDAHRKSGG